jgi:Reverse transcriptase (RNA-dependent DNA polymerase)
MGTLSITEDLWAQQIDFILAYPQADVKTKIYLDPPIGYEEFLAPNERHNDCVLLLKKNVYGLKQAGCTWFQHLQSRLVDLGFTQNKHDHCMFSNQQMVIIVYVDDCLIWGKDKDEIIKVIEQLSREFALTIEGKDIHSNLSIQLDRAIDNSEVHISQPFEIQRIFQFLGYDKDEAKVNKHDTPSDPCTILHANPCKQEWKYHSLLGLLSYLMTITHADIAFAVNNCACFSTKPRGIHEIALKRIIKYLLTTPTQGMVYRPDWTKGLECYVDADFAGNFCPGDPERASCLSRSCYVIMYKNCPIIWASKLQTSVALSTCEAEYVALSTALREVIPLMRLLDTIVDVWNIDSLQPHVVIHEDNQSTCQLAMNEAYKPCMHHLAVEGVLHHR